MEKIGLYDYSKLKGLIKEKNRTQEDVAKKIVMNPSTLSQKLSGKSMFRQEEISSLCSILDIEPKDIGVYFFTN